MWQYAQLTVAYEGRLAPDTGGWTITWYEPDAITESDSRSYADVVETLNAAGNDGWELVDVAALDGSGTGHAFLRRDWSLTRYTFRRSFSMASTRPSLTARRPQGPAQSGSGSSEGTDHDADPQPDYGDGARSERSVAAIRFAVYCQPDRGAPGATGRFFIVREVAPVHDQARIDEFALLGREYESPGVTRDRQEEIKAAAADYAASWTEAQWGDTWWQTPQSFPLSQAADLFNGSAEWLRSLIERPLADVLSAAGADGPMVTVGTGVTANFMTARLTAPFEDAARICEIVGVVVGALTGMHALVMACGKRLAHDVGHELLGKGFESVVDSIERSLRASPGGETGQPGSSRPAPTSPTQETRVHRRHSRPAPGGRRSRSGTVTRRTQDEFGRSAGGIPSGRTTDRRQDADEYEDREVAPYFTTPSRGRTTDRHSDAGPYDSPLRRERGRDPGRPGPGMSR